MTSTHIPEAGPTETWHFVLAGPGKLELVEEALEALQRDWVRVRFVYCGVCGTDVSHFDGRRTASTPVSMGHEWVGLVEAVGQDVPDLRPGHVVTTDLNFRCGDCVYCRRRHSHLCQSGQVGMFTNRGFGLRADIHFSYLVRCRTPPAPRLALAEPLSCALHAVSWASAAPKDHLLVVGAGGIGTCMAFALSHADIATAFDVTDTDRARLDSLEPLLGTRGTTTLSPSRNGYDVVLDCSGDPSGLRSACDHVVPGGRLCTMSHLPADAAGFLLEALLHKDVTFNLSYLNGERGNLERAIRLLEQHWDERWDQLLEVRPPSDLVDAIANRSQSPKNKTIIDLRTRQPGVPVLPEGSRF